MYLDPEKDQEHYNNPNLYRARSRAAIKRNMIIHSLMDIYRDINKESLSYTYKDKTGTPTK